MNSYKIPESVLVIIHTTGLDVLLIERADKPAFWQSVTGSKDTVDEPLLDTAIREVAEETGILIGDSSASFSSAAYRSLSASARGDGNAKAVVSLNNLHDWQLSNVYEIYPVWRYRYAPGITQNTEHVFSLLVPRDILITLAPREHVNYMWLPYREAADKCFSPSNAEAILQLPEHIH